MFTQKRNAERLAARANRTDDPGKNKIDKQRTSATTIDEFKASFPVDGSTATVVLIVGTKLFVANCGDSAGDGDGDGLVSEFLVQRCIKPRVKQASFMVSPML